MNLPHHDYAHELQEKGISRNWRVDISPASITLLKSITKTIYSSFRKKTITSILSVDLIFDSDSKQYDLQPIKSSFRSQRSYFDYNAEEKRNVRDKTFFFQLFNLLKECAIWNCIRNKNTYIQINENNSIFNDKEKIKKFAINELSKLQSDKNFYQKWTPRIVKLKKIPLKKKVA
jgi:hypothetical protein